MVLIERELCMETSRTRAVEEHKKYRRITSRASEPVGRCQIN